MNIYKALHADHEKVKELLTELVSLGENDEADRGDLIERIRDEIIPHARAEESVLYNSMRALDGDKKVVFHGYQEHMEAEALLRTLQVADKIDMGWKATAQKLKESLEHHIQEEEEDIFAEARELFSAEEAEMLGQAFESIKPQIRDESFVKNSMDMVMNMLPLRVSALLRKAA